MASDPLVSRTFKTPRQTTHYVEQGPAEGPLMFFLHGWPSMGLMWRAQMNAFASDGWHCIAPDLRGHGSSTAPAANEAYSIEDVVMDMTELHDFLGGEPAIWVSHDWGTVVAGEVAAHEPRRSRGVVLVSLAYQPDGHALRTVLPLIDRTIYPSEQYPDGQWDYYRYYMTNFEGAVADLDADQESSLASIFRAGDPNGVGKVSPNALVSRNGGRFGIAHRAPRTEPDSTIWPSADFATLVGAFKSHGFRPSCAWYLNDEANLEYASRAPKKGHLSQPVLFVNGELDQICSITGNMQGQPMREACENLTVTSMPSGHWLPLEHKEELVRVIRNWLKSEGL